MKKKERSPKPSLWGKGSRSEDERRFLLRSNSLVSDLLRCGRIVAECIKGFLAFRNVGPCVTVFGSAKFSEEHRYYEMARRTARALGEQGATIVTGGGPGIMEAANRGAKEVGAYAIGCNIQLPKEQKPNRYLDQWTEFRYFFIRKLMLVKYSSAFVVFPGGIGTLDELFEISVLVQTKKIENFSIILMGTDYWAPLIAYLEETVLAQGCIDKQDMSMFTLTDEPEEALRIIQGIW